MGTANASAGPGTRLGGEAGGFVNRDVAWGERACLHVVPMSPVIADVTGLESHKLCCQGLCPGEDPAAHPAACMTLPAPGAPQPQAPRRGRAEPEDPSFRQLVEPAPTRGGRLTGPAFARLGHDARVRQVDIHSAFTGHSCPLATPHPELGLTGPRRGSSPGRGRLSRSPGSLSTHGNAVESGVALCSFLSHYVYF